MQPQVDQHALQQALVPLTNAINTLTTTVTNNSNALNALTTTVNNNHNTMLARISTLDANNRHLLRNSMVSARWRWLWNSC